MISNDVSNNQQPFTVIAPIGAFGNHVRWLLLLDSRYNFTILPSKRSYDIFAGPDWPKFEDYCCEAPLLPQIKDEMCELEHNSSGFVQRSKFSTLHDKIIFFNEKIYSNNRAWHNWLIIEWHYRDALNKLINFNHELKHRSQNFKNVILTIDPHLALKCYLKLNSSLNNKTQLRFCEEIEEHNQQANRLCESNTFLISADVLFQPTLDRELYQSMINWLELEDHYDTAKQIHQNWYNCHQRSQQEFVKFFTALYS